MVLKASRAVAPSVLQEPRELGVAAPGTSSRITVVRSVMTWASAKVSQTFTEKN